MKYEPQMRELARVARKLHGQLKEVVFLKANDKILLVFEDGSVLPARPRGGENDALEADYRNNFSSYISVGLGDTPPFQMLTFGYSGTGPDCFSVFLEAFGFAVTNVEDLEAPLRLQKDGKIVVGKVQEFGDSLIWEDGGSTPTPAYHSIITKRLSSQDNERLIAVTRIVRVYQALFSRLVTAIHYRICQVTVSFEEKSQEKHTNNGASANRTYKCLKCGLDWETNYCPNCGSTIDRTEIDYSKKVTTESPEPENKFSGARIELRKHKRMCVICKKSLPQTKNGCCTKSSLIAVIEKGIFFKKITYCTLDGYVLEENDLLVIKEREKVVLSRRLAESKEKAKKIKADRIHAEEARKRQNELIKEFKKAERLRPVASREPIRTRRTSCCICGKIIYEDEEINKQKSLSPLARALGPELSRDWINNVFCPDIMTGVAMRCNRCGEWVCSDCIERRTLDQGMAGMIQHTNCGGMFVKPTAK